MDKAKKPSLLNLGITSLALIIGLVYGFITLSTEDPLWFVTTFNEIPEEIAFYCYGTKKSLYPEDEVFDALVNQINTILSSRKNYDPLTMSDETYDYYQTSDEVMALEIIYTSKVRIHSFYKFFANLDSIVVPLNGRHSRTNAIFGRSNGFSTAGSLHYASMPELREFVETNDLCLAP